ncbi:MAG: hypothetical protein JWQ28_527 [Pedobacter sp.]|nr:hypothetical protein [Pedobacter sp.]
MKKLFVALLFLSLTSPLFAQQAALPYDFRLGLTAHPTFGWIKAENGKGNGLGLGFSYGLIGDFDFAENYSFSTGLTVTTINGKSTEINPPPYYDPAINTPTAYNIRYKLQYIEVPLTVKLKTAKIGTVRWYGQFGLSNDFNIAARQDVEQVGGVQIADDVNAKDLINFYRAGLILGGGGEFDVAPHTSLTLGLTFNNGFTNISDTDNGTVKNHYLGLNFGVFF